MFVGWGEFYSMVGQAAATLIGLMFVIVTLGAALGGALRRKASESAVPLLVTPTLVHFGAILFIAVVALVPQGSDVAVLIALLACGLAGAEYSPGVRPSWTRPTSARTWPMCRSPRSPIC
jgi:hypothetical protein